MSLDSKPEQHEPVDGIESLVAYLRSGEKPAEQFRVGMEHEKIGLLAGTLDPIPFTGSRGIEELMLRLPRFGYEPFLEGGRPIAATCGSLSISLEPGGQLELSGRPFKCAHECARELRRHLALTRALGAELGQHWLGVGYRPFGTVADAQWMPKGRYGRMRAHLSKTGRLALDMMTMTATVQANYDYSDEADMAFKVRAATSISALVAALFANSPIVQGKESGYLSFRTQVWREMDPARCGLLEAAYRPGFGYRAYAEWALDVPMIFVRRNGTYRDPRGLTFRGFLSGGLDGERASMSDWEDHLTTLFPEVRLKKVIEVRGADGGTYEMCAALPALWKGLLYDRDALAAAEALIDLPFAERVAFQESVAREALGARANGHRALDLCRELVSFAAAGLKRQTSCGADEQPFLDPLRELIEEGRCPAERALQRLHGEYAGDTRRLAEHWRVA